MSLKWRLDTVLGYWIAVTGSPCLAVGAVEEKFSHGGFLGRWCLEASAGRGLVANSGGWMSEMGKEGG